MADLHRDNLLATLERLADHVDGDQTLEVLIVGGAGGLLAGYLPPQRTTMDCDVMVWAPEEAWSRLADAGRAIAGELDLPETWLENASQVFVHRLLPGWETRRSTIFKHGPLTVHVPSRVDFIALKTLAGRDIDVDDVLRMRVTHEEHAFIRARLLERPESHFAHHEIPGALERLDAMFDDAHTGEAAKEVNA